MPAKRSRPDIAFFRALWNSYSVLHSCLFSDRSAVESECNCVIESRACVESLNDAFTKLRETEVYQTGDGATALHRLALRRIREGADAIHAAVRKSAEVALLPPRQTQQFRLGAKVFIEPPIEAARERIASSKRPHPQKTDPANAGHDDGVPLQPAETAGTDESTDGEVTPKDTSDEKGDPPESPKKRLAPSRVKAAAAHDWAMAEIPGADRMTIAQLFDAITSHPKMTGEWLDQLPDNAEAFGKYLRDAGIKRYNAKGERVRRISHFPRRDET